MTNSQRQFQSFSQGKLMHIPHLGKLYHCAKWKSEELKNDAGRSCIWGIFCIQHNLLDMPCECLLFVLFFSPFAFGLAALFLRMAVFFLLLLLLTHSVRLYDRRKFIQFETLAAGFVFLFSFSFKFVCYLIELFFAFFFSSTV